LSVEDVLSGYQGLARKLLEKAGAKIGDLVRIVRSDGSVYEGILMPRYAAFSKPIIVIKLSNGYNVGVKVDDKTVIEVLKTREQILKEAVAGAPAV